MGRFPIVIAVGASGVNLPIQSKFLTFVAEDSLCQGTSADISQTDHQYFHWVNFAANVAAMVDLIFKTICIKARKLSLATSIHWDEIS
jgi:hypothetical protein